MVLAGVVYRTMPADVSSASFLTEEERRVGVDCIAKENKMSVSSEHLSPWQFETIKRGLWNFNTQFVSLGLIAALTHRAFALHGKSHVHYECALATS